MVWELLESEESEGDDEGIHNNHQRYTRQEKAKDETLAERGNGHSLDTGSREPHKSHESREEEYDSPRYTQMSEREDGKRSGLLYHSDNAIGTASRWSALRQIEGPVVFTRYRIHIKRRQSRP